MAVAILFPVGAQVAGAQVAVAQVAVARMAAAQAVDASFVGVWMPLIALVLLSLGLLQGSIAWSGISGLSLTGYRRKAGIGVSVLLLSGSLVLLVLAHEPILRLAIWAVPALLVALGILVGVSLFLRPGMVPPRASSPGDNEPWTAEPVTFQDQHGTATGLLLKPRQAGASGATVCWIHGSGDDKDSFKWVLVRALTRRGLTVLTFCLPGHGDRLSEPCGVLSGQAAVSAALDYLQQRDDADPDRIGLMGVSLGGALAIRALAAGQRAKALALLEVPCSLHWTRWLWWREVLSAVSVPSLTIFRDCSLGGLRQIWSPAANLTCSVEEMFAQLRPEESISLMPPLPLLVVNGGRDPIAPVAHGRRLFRRAKEPKTHRIVRPASHVTLIFMAKTAGLISDWFAETL